MESIVALNSKGTVTRAFEENEDILQKLNAIGIKRMIEVIKTLDITFSRANIERVPSEILVYIFAHRHYALNSLMIKRITEFIAPSLCDQIDTQNYTTVNKLNYTPLIEYIHEYLEDYVQNIVLREFNTHEDNEAILDLLNRCIDNTGLCEKIIQHEEFCLDNFQQCCYDLVDDKQTEVKILWDTLLLENKVKECWENIIFYWESFGLLPELITYIEQHSESLISCSTTCVHDKFIKELITENIDELVLIRLLPYIKMSVFSLSFEILTHNIVSAMISCHYFSFSEERYAELQNFYPELCYDFIANNQTEYSHLIEHITIDIDIFEKLVLSQYINVALIQDLFDKFGVSHMSTRVAQQLSTLPVSIDISIFEAAWNISSSIALKMQLMYDNLVLLDENSIGARLMELVTPYNQFNDRSQRRQIYIPFSENNTKLCERLKELAYITSYSVEEKTDTESDNKNESTTRQLMCRIKQLKG